MRWSFKIGQITGIGIYIHFTFLLLIGFFVLASFSQGENWPLAMQEIAFVLIVFGIIVLHELGHATAARRYGIQTRDITLYPIGGVARLERMPEDPKQELVVALAGPAVNVVLAGVFFGWNKLLPEEQPIHWWSLQEGSLISRLIVVNVWLVLFNMLPAFPMDGGRVLRALLAMRMDYVHATQIAASIGQGMALLFGFLGLFSNPLLIFVALFVWIGAAQEASMVQIKSALGGIPVSRAMIRDFQTLTPPDSLELAVDHILAGFQQDFPVLEHGKVVGVLTRGGLLTALAKQGEEGTVGEVMEQKFETAEPTEMLDRVFARLQECECRSMPVMKNGQLVGMITLENVGEFLMIQTALRSAHPQKNEKPMGNGN